MERSAIFLFTGLFLSACSSMQYSAPLSSTLLSRDTLQWQSHSPPITQCQSNILRDFDLTLKENGEWHCTAVLSNLDNHGSRPDWLNEISLKFQNGSETPVTLSLFEETVQASSKRVLESSGTWTESKNYFQELKTAHLKINHQCEIVSK